MLRMPVAPRLVSLTAIALTCAAAACDRHSPTSPTQVTAVVQTLGVQPLSLGEVAVGQVTTESPSCSYDTSDGGWGGLCQIFEVMAANDGAMAADVTSTNLEVFAKTADGQQIDMKCCGGGRLVFPVKAGAAYHVELAYFGRPLGYPSIAPAAYRIMVSMATSNNTPTLRLHVFDTSRSQQVSTAHIAVIGGPASGRPAAFHRSTGLYYLQDLPPGYVTVAVSAAGFVDQQVEIPIGTSVPAEVFLPRDASLQLDSAQLAARAWASDDHKQVWSGALIEVLDGPLAGEFAFTDEMGRVSFNGLPLGPVRVRGSYGSFEQTLTVTVVPRTIIGFELH